MLVLRLNSDPLPGFLEVVDIRRIRPSTRTLRKDIGSVDGLMASIAEKGLLQPIVVRPRESGYEVVAGHRRFEACKRLRLYRVPCHIVELDDKEAYEVSLIENVQHRTLNPVEEAESFRRYVDEYGYGGVTELARRIGKSEQYVSQRLQLLRLPKDALAKLSTRVVTPSQVRDLVGMSEDKQRKAIELIVEQQLSSRNVRRTVEQVLGEYAGDQSLEMESYRLPSAERRISELNRALGKCIASLKMSLMKFDDALDNVDENEWVIRESLMQHRQFLHQQIDTILKLKRRLRRAPPP